MSNCCGLLCTIRYIPIQTLIFLLLSNVTLTVATLPGSGRDKTFVTKILKKNLFPAHLIERVVNRYITGTQSNHCPRDSLPTSPTFYFKLPYTGHFSVVTQKKIRHFIKRYCNDLDIKLVFSSFKIGNMFSVKDPVPDRLRRVWFISLHECLLSRRNNPTFSHTRA